MDSQFNDFFKEERKRVFEPDVYFAKRVVARLKEQPVQESGLWDVVLGATRPVFAVALTLVLALICIQMLVPAQPARGMVEAFLDRQVPAGESLIYSDSEAAPNHDVLEQMMVLESGQ